MTYHLAFVSHRPGPEKEISALLSSALPPFLVEPWGTRELALCVCATFKESKKNLFFCLLQIKFYVLFCFLKNCNIQFPYPKETWCLALLVFMKNTF